MRKFSTLFVMAAALLFGSTQGVAGTEPKVAIVDFRVCAEESALGKKQQENFEGLKQQIQDVMDEKEKELRELADKFQDADYLDSLSPEAEQKMKEEFQHTSAEYNQMQQQFFQTLQQANVQIVRLIGDSVQEHAKTVAKTRGIDMVLNAESTFYFDSPYDMTKEVIAAMDVTFEKEAKDTTESAE